MLPFCARWLRTALFTAALLTAVSLPATEAQAASEKRVARSHLAGTAQHYDRFPLVTGGDGGHATAIGGVVSWAQNRFVYGGTLEDAGRGTSRLTLRLVGPSESSVRFFTADNTTLRTDVEVEGSFTDVEVTLCWQLANDQRCDTRSVRRHGQ